MHFCLPIDLHSTEAKRSFHTFSVLLLVILPYELFLWIISPEKHFILESLDYMKYFVFLLKSIKLIFGYYFFFVSPSHPKLSY